MEAATEVPAQWISQGGHWVLKVICPRCGSVFGISGEGEVLQTYCRVCATLVRGIPERERPAES